MQFLPPWLFVNRKADAPPEVEEYTTDLQRRANQEAMAKGFTLRDFGSYVADLIQHTSGGGGWDGIYEFQSDFVRRLTDTLKNEGGSYQEMASLVIGNSTAKTCLDIIAQNISSIKWEMVRTTAGGEKIVAPDHALLRLFQDPGLYDAGETKRTKLSLWEPIVHHLHFGGEVFIQLGNRPLNDDGGRRSPLTFTILHPRWFKKFIRDEANRVTGYRFDVERGGHETPVFLSTNQVLHWKRYHCGNEERGLPLAQGARMSLMQAAMAAQWNLNLSKSGGRQQAILSPKGLKPGKELPPEVLESVEKYLDEMFRRRQFENLPLLLSGAFEYIAANVTPRDADFQENDKANTRKISSGFKVPSILVGDVDSQGLGGGSALKQAEGILWRNCLLPILDDFVEEINLNLAPRFGDQYFLEYDKNQIDALQENLDKKTTRIHRATGKPWMTPNEAREQMGMSQRTDQEEFEKLGTQGTRDSERDDSRSEHPRNNEAENPNERD
ncbi:MAG: phage portal protein [Bacteroidetes bacterium]|nr:phage portal protein [Bacteroidota bacterium]